VDGRRGTRGVSSGALISSKPSLSCFDPFLLSPRLFSTLLMTSYSRSLRCSRRSGWRSSLRSSPRSLGSRKRRSSYRGRPPLPLFIPPSHSKRMDLSPLRVCRPSVPLSFILFATSIAAMPTVKFTFVQLLPPRRSSLSSHSIACLTSATKAPSTTKNGEPDAHLFLRYGRENQNERCAFSLILFLRPTMLIFAVCKAQLDRTHPKQRKSGTGDSPCAGEAVDEQTSIGVAE
jgi:hypothetical protein